MKKVLSCRFCGASLSNVIHLGHHPHSDYFPESIDVSIVTYPLALCFCSNCTLYQLDYDLDTHTMFNNEYLYDNSVNSSMHSYWANLAKEASSYFSSRLDREVLALDVGSNSGEFVHALDSNGFNVVGLEPSLQPHLIAKRLGRRSIHALFDSSFAEKNQFKFDLISFTNSFPHIPNPLETFNTALMCLKPDGIILIESPYSLSMLELGQYDQIYHQHMTYLNATSIKKLSERFDCSIIGCMPSEAQNGSLAYFVSKKKVVREDKYTTSILEQEAKFFENHWGNNLNFVDKVLSHRQYLRLSVESAKSKEIPVFCITAPAKGNTILNFCGLDQNDIIFATEKNTLKLGRFTPCSNIPIVSDDQIQLNKPSLGIVLGWNLFNVFTNKFKNTSISLISPIKIHNQ